MILTVNSFVAAMLAAVSLYFGEPSVLVPPGAVIEIEMMGGLDET